MPIDLGDNLILRFARPDDVDALVEFNARVFSVKDGDARFPDLTFLQLLCGRCRFNELKTNFVDCDGRDEADVLLDCLFPPFTGNVWCLS